MVVKGVTGGPAIRDEALTEGRNIIKCYSGGKVVQTIKLTEGLEYEPDDNGFSLANKDDEIVFIWNGTYAVIHSSFKG